MPFRNGGQVILRSGALIFALLAGDIAPTIAETQTHDYAKDFEYWSKAITDPDPRKRGDAAFAMVWLGRAGQPVVPPLVKAIDDPDKGVRFSAIHSLGELGPRASAAVPRLAVELGAEDGGGAQIALVRIGAASVPGLLEIAARSPEPVKYRAALTLYLIQPEGFAAATSALGTSRDPAFRQALAKASVIVNERAVPGLVKALKDSAAPVRVATASSVGLIAAALKWGGREALPVYREAMAALTRARTDASPAVRAAVEKAFDRLQGPPDIAHLEM